MNSLKQSLARALVERRQQGLERRRPVLDSPQGPSIILDGQRYDCFCSNDYLGLANHPAVSKAFQEGLERYGAGSGASHLVAGHSSAHHRLEEALAAFTGRSRALLFSSGYSANLGVLGTLPGKQDALFQDRLNHASLLDGGRLSEARSRRFPHRDIQSLTAMLGKSAVTGRHWLVTDGVFSMDGDLADIPGLLALRQAESVELVVDDAHGFGVLGSAGGGTLAHFREQGHHIDEENCAVLIGTLGKSFGTSGAFVAGSEELVETLLQFCRPYIYTTAMPPAIAVATLRSLELLQTETWRRESLQDMIQRFRRHCQDLGLTLTDSITPIQGILVGDVDDASRASQRLLEQGIHVSAIRPPTVPAGTARLRVTFSAAHQEPQFRRLLNALEDLAGLLEYKR